MLRMKKQIVEIKNKNNDIEKMIESESTEYLDKYGEHNEMMLRQMKLSESSVDMARMLSLMGIRAMSSSVKRVDEQAVRLKKIRRHFDEENAMWRKNQRKQ